jgi:hypothetical protein
MSETRFEHALNETEGLGNWRRDLTVIAIVAAVVFAGLRLLASGSLIGNLLYSLLVGFGVLVVLPLFELLWNYRKAPKTALEGEIARVERSITELRAEEETPPRPDEAALSEPEGPQQEEQEQERYRSLRERLVPGGRPKEGPGPE